MSKSTDLLTGAITSGMRSRTALSDPEQPAATEAASPKLESIAILISNCGFHLPNRIA